MGRISERRVLETQVRRENVSQHSEEKPYFLQWWKEGKMAPQWGARVCCEKEGEFGDGSVWNWPVRALMASAVLHLFVGSHQKNGDWIVQDWLWESGMIQSSECRLLRSFCFCLEGMTLYSPGWPLTYYVARMALNLILLRSTSQVLELQGWLNFVRSNFSFLLLRSEIAGP